ncbi:rod-binding protein [Siccirubricoccus sp. KC 17139]|uniref:Rod-binding protein n=1 Tax=Siccirubricoccus soli TaxID=2899147 RepID=A0ABT1D3Y3_9PROT|nr:rod-binding protein [Siccirubricoccus soli]MCO6415990.1 rod-binding protein [Siccirubricoccus soli]MCP2682122.1 rod-binding protein [Siccirubricoccus soli]
MTGSALTPAQRAAIPPRLQQAARAFEAQAFAALLKPAFATADPSRGAFGGGAAEASWQPMLIDAIAERAVRGGHGLGLGEAILREMLRRQGMEVPPG